MNNAKIASDNIFEETPFFSRNELEKKRSELAKLIEVINRIVQSKDWATLKSLLLDDVALILERQLVNEANKKEVNMAELYRLQGQVAWARKYTDLSQLAEFYKKQVAALNIQLHGKKTNSGDGAS